jgi:hypothetical protein
LRRCFAVGFHLCDYLRPGPIPGPRLARAVPERIAWNFEGSQSVGAVTCYL